ncbi:pseudouridine synthase [Taibaiella sp. KBW10]|uniref:pseudouridine synthase n=1 Tax=Taibaiella sp. KBW10 TaxID=2153357 RepID=UPI000F58F8B1|nr:pseudouridine synthase [Taibaiella sp. KBW10]RQO30111.1 pseudouridine synthase [Taibaiella sp. KBW10]
MPQHTYILFYKPFQVLSQFSEEGDKKTLAHFFPNIEKNIYPVGRLDYDSEGLLLLTNDKKINHQLLDPKQAHQRTYYVQVEGTPTPESLIQLAQGVSISINGAIHKTSPAKASLIPEPQHLPERNPPIRFRKNIPTAWIALTLTEGKNRQVRKMTAAVGFPTLRLIRYSIGQMEIGKMNSGDAIALDQTQLALLFQKTKA